MDASLNGKQLNGTSQSQMAQWLAASLSRGELELLRALRGPIAMFRPGELLALLPMTFLR
jgi:hypothetical protein